MFAGYKDIFELPTEADRGKFIPQKEMEAWWKQMQKKFPSIYPPDEVSLRHISCVAVMSVSPKFAI
jgi:hypothetical protein